MIKHLKAGVAGISGLHGATISAFRAASSIATAMEETTRKRFEASYQHSQKYIDNLDKIETKVGNIIAQTARVGGDQSRAKAWMSRSSIR